MTNSANGGTVERQTYTVPEAAKILGIGRNQAYDAAARGQIPTIRIGNRLVVPRTALERLLAGEVLSSEPNVIVIRDGKG